MTNAVVSLLYNTNYLPGAIVLGLAIRKIIAITDYEVTLALLIDRNNFNEYQLTLLSEIYDELIDVELFTSHLSDKLSHELGRPELDKTFTKIQLWSLYDKFDKILYLDVDTLPNIPRSKEQGSILNLLKVDFPENKILAAPDSGFPDVFNSGVFLLKPNLVDYYNLLALVNSSSLKISFDGADQGLLNQYFNSQPDWVTDLLNAHTYNIEFINSTKSSNWVQLPFLYNTTPSAQYEYLPAYKYFANPIENKVNDEQTNFDHQSQLDSTNETLNRYHSAAFNYYDGPDTQVKLVHFIGPFKPWTSSSKEGIFTNWWQIWDEKFNGKSIDSVIFDQGNYIFSQDSPTEFDEQIDDVLEEIEQVATTHQEIDVSKPADLCDPKNYQHIPGISQSADSTWDPAKEPPPKSETLKDPPFIEDFKPIVNAWDNGNQEQQKNEIIDYQGSPVSPEKIQEISKDLAAENSHIGQEFGYHKDQQPERVFAHDSDYIPTHLLMPLQKPEPRKVMEDDDPKMDPVENLSNDAISFNKVNEKLMKLGLAEDVLVPEEEEQDDAVLGAEDISKAPKLFPWEFQNRIKPERVFD